MRFYTIARDSSALECAALLDALEAISSGRAISAKRVSDSSAPSMLTGLIRS